MPAQHEEMMILPVEKRREYFRKVYTAELGRLHATGKCAWPIERLGGMVENIMASILKRQAPAGPAFDATMKFFGMNTKKSLFAFLESV